MDLISCVPVLLLELCREEETCQCGAISLPAAAPCPVAWCRPGSSPVTPHLAPGGSSSFSPGLTASPEPRHPPALSAAARCHRTLASGSRDELEGVSALCQLWGAPREAVVPLIPHASREQAASAWLSQLLSLRCPCGARQRRRKGPWPHLHGGAAGGQGLPQRAEDCGGGQSTLLRATLLRARHRARPPAICAQGWADGPQRGWSQCSGGWCGGGSWGAGQVWTSTCREEASAQSPISPDTATPARCGEPHACHPH